MKRRLFVVLVLENLRVDATSSRRSLDGWCCGDFGVILARRQRCGSVHGYRGMSMDSRGSARGQRPFRPVVNDHGQPSCRSCWR